MSEWHPWRNEPKSWPLQVERRVRRIAARHPLKQWLLPGDLVEAEIHFVSVVERMRREGSEVRHPKALTAAILSRKLKDFAVRNVGRAKQEEEVRARFGLEVAHTVPHYLEQMVAREALERLRTTFSAAIEALAEARRTLQEVEHDAGDPTQRRVLIARRKRDREQQRVDTWGLMLADLGLEQEESWRELISRASMERPQRLSAAQRKRIGRLRQQLKELFPELLELDVLRQGPRTRARDSEEDGT